jgi:hypothetical protein
MSERAAEPADSKKEEKADHFEIIAGVVLAAFAAILAVADLGGGKFGDEELIAHNEKTNQFMWYHAKSIKETQIEGQKISNDALLKNPAIPPELRVDLEETSKKLDDKLGRYKKEKKEILLGSSKVGQENWAQDVDGELGKVIGAKEWEAKSEALNEAGDQFNYAQLFLQLCLVLGAVSLVLKNDKMKTFFFSSMVILGVIGAGFTIYAFRLALAIA